MWPYMLFAPDDGGGTGDETDPKSKEDTGGKDAPKFSDEDKALLKAVDIDPDNLIDPKLADQVLVAVKKGKHFKDKADEAEKLQRTSDRKARDTERSRKRKDQDLKAANLVDADGNLIAENVKALQESAARADGMEALIGDLAPHLSEKVAKILQDEDDPAVISGALKYIDVTKPDSISKEEFDTRVQKGVDEALKKRGVNDDERDAAGRKETKTKPSVPSEFGEYLPDDDPDAVEAAAFLGKIGSKKEEAKKE